jgi:hypothetical protein
MFTPKSHQNFQINFSDNSTQKVLDLEQRIESMALDWKGHYLYLASFNDTMTSAFSILRVGFVVDNRWVGRVTR